MDEAGPPPPAAGWIPCMPRDLELLPALFGTCEPGAMNLMDSLFHLDRTILRPWKSDWHEFSVRYVTGGSTVAMATLSRSGYLLTFSDPGAGKVPWEPGIGMLTALPGFRRMRPFGAILFGAGSKDLPPPLAGAVWSGKEYRVLAVPPPAGAVPGPWPGRPPAGPSMEGLEFRPATPRDERDILDIQCSYELEEVLLDPGDLDRSQTLARLGAALRTQRIQLAFADRVPVAKAGSNALSWSHIQIGGVYTEPAWRNRGIATALVDLLVQEARASGRGACLFVKKDNPPALAVYRRTGFRPCGDLEIVYFRYRS